MRTPGLRASLLAVIGELGAGRHPTDLARCSPVSTERLATWQTSEPCCHCLLREMMLVSRVCREVEV